MKVKENDEMKMQFNEGQKRQMICYRIAVKRPASLKIDSERRTRLSVRAKQVGITFSGLKMFSPMPNEEDKTPISSSEENRFVPDQEDNANIVVDPLLCYESAASLFEDSEVYT
ncbi:hypothetical protein QL285_035586 [Trifolium repens]|nr:hypothetical protein QL285_035586 [Trifolium repens]